MIRRKGLLATAILLGLGLLAATVAGLTPVAWAVPGPISPADSHIVAINEVAWGGTTYSSLHEWIELHNTTAATVSLVGWTLEYRDGLSCTIP